MSFEIDYSGRKRLAASLCLTVLLLSPGLNVYAATGKASSSSSSKPSLKAIDPSQAKMDSMPQAASPSPNPLGGIQGAPISADKPQSLPQGGWAPQYPPGSGYPAPSYVQPQAQRPAYPPQYQGGYPPQQPAYGQGYPQQQQMPAAPPGYPQYPPQQPQYGYGQPPAPQYGAPQYGGGYGAQPGFVQSPPGYPQMPPQQPPQQTALPPGFVQPNQQQQQQQQGNFPAGRARLGGGHPNLVPQGAPATAGPTAPPGFVPNQPYQGGYPPPQGGYGGQPGFNPGYQQQGGYAPQGGGYPPQGGGYAPQGGYPPQGGYAPTGGPPSQFPSASLIPEFGKPLPMDASNKGPAQMWTTNQPMQGTGGGGMGGPPAQDPDEARVTRLEKVAFGSTYPEHEVIDRVDHLEKEIFGDTSNGDLSSRLRRLENKLGGGSGNFGSPMRGSQQYGSYSGGSPSGNFPAPSVRQPQSAIAGGGAPQQTSSDDPPPDAGLAATQLALKQPSGAASPDDTASASASDDGSATEDEADDAPASSSSDTTDSGPAPQASGGSTDLKVMAGGGSQSSSDTAGAPVKLRIPFDKGAGDYTDRISKFVNNTTARWTHFPVKVRLPEDVTPDWKKLMEPAVDKWGRYVPLKFASQTESADIEVSFVNHLVPRVLGVTRLTVTSGRMKVYIFMLRPNYYPQLAEKTLTAAFIHELGHAIGLFGHSDKPGDAMYTFETVGNGKLTQEKLGSVSARDVNTLKKIYDSEPLPDDFNLSAPQEWSLFTEASS